MSGRSFVDEMDATLWQLLGVRDAALAGLKEAVTRSDTPQLLLGALRTEMEAAELAAAWVGDSPEVEVKLAFARQAGDEAKHYMLIADRLGDEQKAKVVSQVKLALKRIEDEPKATSW